VIEQKTGSAGTLPEGKGKDEKTSGRAGIPIYRIPSGRDSINPDP